MTVKPPSSENAVNAGRTTPSAAENLASPGARGWGVVALLWFAGCLNYLDRVMITTMRGSIVEAIPMSEAQFGLLTTLFLVVYAALSPVTGFLADRLNRSALVIGSLCVWSLCTWLTAYAQSYPQLLATRAGMGVSEAFYMPAAMALVVDYHRGSTRSRACGLLLTGAMVGAALGGLGGWLAEHRSWTFAFEFFGVIGVGYAAVLLILLRDPPSLARSETEPVENLPSARISDVLTGVFPPSYLLLLVYAVLLGAVSWAVVGWMPTCFQEQFHLSQSAAGLYTTLYLNGAAMAGMMIGGAWADHWSRTNERGRVYVGAIGLALASPAILLTATTQSLPIALAGLVAYGLTRYFADPSMMAIICRVVDPRYRATCWGILTFTSCAVGGAGIYAGGLLRDAEVEIRHVFQFAAANVVVCAALLVAVRYRAAAKA